MAIPPAAVSDYEALFGPPPDETRCAAQLARAARVISAEASRASVDPATLDRATVVDVMCDMVRYVTVSADELGATGSTLTAGPFTRTVQYQAPSGGMCLTRAHRRLLGIPAQALRQYRLLPTFTEGDSGAAD